MIMKRNSRTEMPDLKICELEDRRVEENGGNGDDDDENGKTQRMAGCFYSVKVKADFDYLRFMNSLRGELTSGASAAGEVSYKLEEVMMRKKNRIPPPLLKSSRGRVQVPSSKYNDDSNDKKGKSEIAGFTSCSDDYGKFNKEDDDVQADGDFFMKRRKYENGYGGLNVYPVYGKVNEGKFDCAEIQSFEPRKCSGLNGSSTSSFDINSMELVENDVLLGPNDLESILRLAKEKSGKIKELRSLNEEKKDEFVRGDIVWAKSGKRYPAWPAIVIDPVTQAPKSVLRCFVPGTTCVMYFGYSKNGTRDYAWVKGGMIFPFEQNRERFHGQTNLYTSKPSDFRMAIDEASIAAQDLGSSIHGFGPRVYEELNPNGDEEAAGSDQENHLLNEELIA